MDKDVKRELSAYWQQFQLTPEQERRVDNDVFDSFVQCYLADEERLEALQTKLEALEDALREIAEADIREPEWMRRTALSALALAALIPAQEGEG